MSKDVDPKQALYRVLDAVFSTLPSAPMDRWLAGNAAFEASQKRGETLEASLEAAVTAAAPDMMSQDRGLQAIRRPQSTGSKTWFQALKAELQDQYVPERFRANS